MSVIRVNARRSDVEDTMRAVADALRQWEEHQRVSPDAGTAPDRSKGLVKQVHQLVLQSNIDGSAIIHSTRPGVGPWIIRFQMIVRRLTWWFLEPILQQIRLFGMNTTRAFEKVAEDQERVTARTSAVADLARRLDGVEEALVTLQRRMDEADERETRDA